MKTTLFFFLIIFCGMVCFFPQNGFAQEPIPMVRLIYFLPNDRTPDPKIDTRMDTLIKDTQQLYAELMEGYGSGRKTFPIETNTRGKVIVHHINGRFDDAYYIDKTTDKVLEEISGQFDISENIYLIAIDISNQGIDNRTACGVGTFRGQFGGFALIPAAGRCFNVSVTAHELGHAFGLSHDYRRDAKVIPSSYTWDQTIISFCAAEWLDVHRYFNAGQQDRDVSPTEIAMLPPTSVSESNTIRLRFEVTDLDGLHQAQLLIPEATYSGALIDCKSLNETSSVVEFTTTELTPKNDWVELRVIDANGNFTSHWFPIDIISLFPPSKVISMPDENLASVVREYLNLPPDTVLTSHKMLELTHLNAPDRQITDLTGLEYALNLRELWLGIASFQPDPNKYISSNAISDLSPIEELTQLYWLMLANPSETAVSQLPELTQLDSLQIYNPPISDVSVFAKLTQLEVLSIYNASTPDVSALVSVLSGLTQLRGLSVGVPISDTDVSVLAKLTQLTSLGIEGSAITDISPLAELTQLESLNIEGSAITDISPLAELTQLESLTLHESPISDISALAGLTQLWNLEILETSVSDISALAGLTQLRWLKLGNSPISDISPLAGLTEVTQLGIWNTSVSDISPLVGLTQLNWLNLIGSPLSYPSIHTYIPAIQARGASVHFGNVAHPALLKVSGDAQEGASGAALAIPFVVEAIDANGKPMQGVSVTFAVTEGSGKLSATTTTTDSAGKAQTTLQLGRNPGKHIVTATAMEITPSVLTFTAVAVGEAVRIAEDVNGDGTVDIQDLVFVASNLGKTGENDADVNGDGIVDIRDLIDVAAALDTPAAAAPALNPRVLSAFTTKDVQKWISEAQHLNLTDPTAQKGIRFLEQLLRTLIPKTTSLLPNYPNPFNPETWIPYTLAKPADVTLTIYAVNGQIVRQIPLGHRSAGSYQSKNRAAYWDGRNAVGKPVASGIYFYTLTAGNFTATRKMVIRK